ncbi:mitochondrial inner membrane protein MPV17 isoform X1 [Halictus rubicundus]|uniref:mitochondrial inner membrane protein MPV17 isoform X1 n=1 Tax=Halictus rubicundus TaxID=77578 RepID=UPI004036DC56
MRSVMILYQRLLSKYPLRTQAVQAGILMGLGDQIAQNLIERKEIRDLDYKRTAQFACIGLCIAGPATRTWYGILDRYIGSKGGIVVLKKVCCDQLLFAPTFILCLLTIIGILQGNDIEGLKVKLKKEYSEILINNYKVTFIILTFMYLKNLQVMFVSGMAYGTIMQLLFCSFAISSLSSTIDSSVMEFLHFLYN